MRKLSLVLTLIAAAGLGCGSTARTFGGGGDGDAGGGGGGGGGGGDGGGSADGSCGTVNEPQGTPIWLPDTNLGNENPVCTSAAQCSASAPNCVITGDTTGGPGFCAQSYVDTLDFIGFGSGETLTDTTKLLSVCATMEHSWIGDLQIDLTSPDGKTVALRQFTGRIGGGLFLGHPDFCGTDAAPLVGSGYQYCWTMTATTKLTDDLDSNCAAASGCESWSGSPMNDSCSEQDASGLSAPFSVIPAGNYLPDVDFTALQGAQLNGNWTFRVTDLWAIDYGYLFDWSIQWDSSLIANCSNPIIE